MLIAWDANQETLDGIKAGTIDSTIAQKPFTMGYYGLKALDEIFHAPPTQLGKDYSIRSVLAVSGVCGYGNFAGGQEQRGSLHCVRRRRQSRQEILSKTRRMQNGGLFTEQAAV